jgi:two-component system nitrate/nitrite response regulator NarL
MDEVRVVVVSEDPLVRGGLVSLLTGQSGIVLEGQLAPDELSEEGDSGAEVAVWDVGPGSSGLERLAELEPRGLRVLAVLADETQASDALGAGARGVVRRDVDASRLAAALQALARGLLVLDPAMAESVLRPRPSAAAPLEPLTPREHEVLQLLAEGLSNKRIAARLGISDHTAKFHVNAIFGKLGAQSRTEALAQAVRLGLVLL